MAEAPLHADLADGQELVRPVTGGPTKEQLKEAEQQFNKLTPRQQRAYAIATRQAMRSFEWWVRLYSGPRWLAGTVLFLRNTAIIYIPVSLILWIVNLMRGIDALFDSPLALMTRTVLSVTWRILTSR